MEAHDRYREYTGPMCWQGYLRSQNLDEDLASVGISKEEADRITIDDLRFEHVPKSDTQTCNEIKEFIKRHEWLGKIPSQPTYRFTATHKYLNVMVGVVIMAVPTAFSNLLGKDTRRIEQLIARGASISFAPKNTGSWLIAKSIRWMVNNTPYRLFIGYSDPEAKELGTIYQACNFMYLGQKSGSKKQYFDPEKPHLGWFSDRKFRVCSSVVKAAKKVGVSNEDRKRLKESFRPRWDTMPAYISKEIKAEQKAHMARCKVRIVPAKHKYALIRGRDKRETKQLMKLFEELNPKLVGLEYPKERVLEPVS